MQYILDFKFGYFQLAYFIPIYQLIFQLPFCYYIQSYTRILHCVLWSLPESNKLLMQIVLFSSLFCGENNWERSIFEWNFVWFVTNEIKYVRFVQLNGIYSAVCLCILNNFREINSSIEKIFSPCVLWVVGMRKCGCDIVILIITDSRFCVNKFCYIFHYIRTHVAPVYIRT